MQRASGASGTLSGCGEAHAETHLCVSAPYTKGPFVNASAKRFARSLSSSFRSRNMLCCLTVATADLVAGSQTRSSCTLEVWSKAGVSHARILRRSASSVSTRMSVVRPRPLFR